MPALALICALALVAAEQLLQWRYGLAGIVGFLLLSVGTKSRNPAVSTAGALLLALLVAGPAI
ncbi:hypothetical protein [Streptomyces sp. NPDC085596]|uniref:hypothetical protein n=1 Tax=Streptomyces sp. NPDC085596 TaxID=3365731 RepID=UPI0037CF8D0E